MRRRHISWVHSLVFCLIFQAISGISASAQSPATPPYVLHLPGVGGYLFVDRSLIAGLKQGGVGQDISYYDWTNGHVGIPALHAYDENHRQAAHVAEMIAKQLADDPGRRVVVTSHSGGGAIAVWAMEDLPAGDEVNDVLLLAPALSPDYDLTAALRHVKDHIYLFWSSGDGFIIGLGCRVCGTMDGKTTNAAGYVGFVRPPSGDAGQYAKLQQRAYDPNWMWLGNFGDHIGPMAQPFAAKVLAPLVLGTSSSQLAQNQPSK
jgi:hypothetical protein